MNANIAGYLNTESHQWVFRFSKYFPNSPLGMGARRENFYGYGATWAEALEELMRLVPAPTYMVYLRDEAKALRRFTLNQSDGPQTAVSQ